jgi:hypothetical protein
VTSAAGLGEVASVLFIGEDGQRHIASRLRRCSSGNWYCPFATELVDFQKSRDSATNLISAKLVTPYNRD